MIKKFYFTYGTDPEFPFCGGWTEVRAQNFMQAIEIFKAHHPCLNGNILNCADFYTEEEFEKHKFFSSGNLGHVCHEVLCAVSNPTELFERDLLTLSRSINNASCVQVVYRFSAFCGEVNFAAKIGLISGEQRISLLSAAKAVIRIYKEAYQCGQATKKSSQ